MKIFSKDKKNDLLKYEFLPSALEIAETPASPLGSFIIQFIFLIMVSFIVWASIGEVDIVAVARGKVVPAGSIKVIQSLEEGIVTGIFVEEGDKVKENDLLLSLDNTIKELDENTIRRDIEIAILEKEILSMYLKGEDITNLDEFANSKEVGDEVKDILKDFSISMNENYNSQKGILEALKSQIEEELEFSKTELSNLEEKLTEAVSNEKELKLKKDNYLSQKNEIEIKMNEVENLRKDENEAKMLFESGNMEESEYQIKKEALESKNMELAKLQENFLGGKGEEYIEKHSASISNLENINNRIQLQKIKVSEMQTKLDEANYKLKNFDEDNKLQVLNKSLEKQKEIEHLKASLAKAEKSITYQSIKSPVNGTVQGISQNTIGGVVKAAESVVTIVPENTPLLVEAMVQNKDIGYIENGQTVSIKVDAYPFQKFGLIEGTVEKISPDAFDDEKYGLVYKIKISINEPHTLIEDEKMNLSSGMSVVAEIKTGKRKIIEFLLEPLVKYTSEAFQIR